MKVLIVGAVLGLAVVFMATYSAHFEDMSVDEDDRFDRVVDERARDLLRKHVELTDRRN